MIHQNNINNAKQCVAKEACQSQEPTKASDYKMKCVCVCARVCALFLNQGLLRIDTSYSYQGMAGEEPGMLGQTVLNMHRHF